MDAITIANYYISKSKQDKPEHELTVLRLVKLVYIAYGHALTKLLNRCIINPRFDKVEAWKLGPVIPSVYHTFKYNGTNPVTELGGYLRTADDGYGVRMICPEVPEDEKDLKKLLDIVWRKYNRYTTAEIIDLLHREGTPWEVCYKPNCNCEIPEEYTRMYYENVVKAVLKYAGHDY